MTESFPRQHARTQRFTLGAPRAFRLSPDGKRVVFLRSKGGDDPVTCLWEADTATGTERLIADPAGLGADEQDLPPQERARRERSRETAAGIVSYATDSALSVAVFALAGQVYAAALGDGEPYVRPVPARAPALDPRPDPAGRRVAYVHDGTLRVTDLQTGTDSLIIAEDGVSYGLAEFIAAEEMERTRGYWWSPDSSSLLVERVDESPVQRWYIADPASPWQQPAEVAYPSAGTPNAGTSLVLVTVTGEITATAAADENFPYLVEVNFDGEPLIVVQARDQKTMRITDLAGRVIREDTDPDWTDVVSGVPARLGDGRIVWTELSHDTRRLIIGTEQELRDHTAGALTPPGLQVRAVHGADGDSVLFTGSDEPTEVRLFCYGPGGLTELSEGPGVHGGHRRGGTTVLVSRCLDRDDAEVRIGEGATIKSLAEQPALPAPDPVIFGAGEREIRTAVLFPSGHRPGTRLPVLLDPYGGPHAQRVLKSRSAFLTSQWFAEQGFAVVVADGRGTPARGPAWDRTVAGDLAAPVLEDQITALRAAAARFGDLDLSRVAIRGWSFGGYLAALAVLRRPDVFHAAVAGAPPTDWHLYDTHYTERYLGFPGLNAEGYQRSSLFLDTERTGPAPRRPLLLIHGLADDNVTVANTLRLSSALLAAGHPHSVLPLTGVTHMTPQEDVAENLLVLQAEFLHRSLPPAAPS